MVEIETFFSINIGARGIAQLGERLNGIQEVSGSIPLISTKTNHKATALWFVLCKRKMRNRIPGQKVTEVFRRKHICDFFDSFNYSAGPHSLENQGFPIPATTLIQME